jgi:hypothetical protein
MKTIQETFLETDWDDEETARAARDARAEELQAQGLICTRENLYNVSGYRVFLVEAREAESIEPRIVVRDKKRPSPRGERSSRTIPDYEER